MKRTALGIPDRDKKTNPRSIFKPEIWNFAIQQHKAQKAGLHYDLRLVDPRTGKAHSWAVRNLPNRPGEKTLAVQQPDHTAEYSTWEGKIESGYGAGTVKLFSSDKIEIVKSDPTHVLFNVYKSNGDTERYALINTSGGEDWLFFNITPTRESRPETKISKPKFKSVAPADIDVTNKTQILAPKYDGALNAFVLRKNKPIEVYSYRPSKKGPSKLIDHTYRLGLYKTTTPETLKGKTVLLGEVFAKNPLTGEVLSSRDTAARLLSNVWRSRELQKQAPLDHVVFDVMRYEGRDVSQKPYKDKLEILRKVVSQVPDLKLPPIAETTNEKQQLLTEISAGINPITREGVVVYNLDQPVPLKAKLFKDFDVKIQNIFPGKGKYEGRGAGGFTYSYINDNKTVGRVGTGFSDELRKELYENPENYKGLVVRVLAQEKLPSGALRMPVFKDIRSEKWPRTKKASMTTFYASPDPTLVQLKKKTPHKVSFVKIPINDNIDSMPVPPVIDNIKDEVLSTQKLAAAFSGNNMAVSEIVADSQIGPVKFIENATLNAFKQKANFTNLKPTILTKLIK